MIPIGSKAKHQHNGHVVRFERFELPHPRTRPQMAEAGYAAPIERHSWSIAGGYRPTARLAGKVAIITGADGGIGRAVAFAYAREGADVALLQHREGGEAEETRRGIEELGRRALSIAGDVTCESFCKRAVQQVVAELGGVDILVCAAAVREPANEVEALSRDQLERAFSVNVYGYVFMVQASLPVMLAGSAIIATGSESGIFGCDRLPGYSATQGAIHALTRSLAQQLLPRGIRVNAVAPGPLRLEADVAGAALAGGGELQDPRQGASARGVRADEIAPAYVYFASNADSGFVTGQVLAELGGAPR